jgi:RNA polymerase sigma-70 factor (ECF subfamily)
MRVSLPRMGPRRRNLGALGDEELMVLVAEHDADAFEVVYDRHGSAAYSLAYRTTGQQVLAEEVVQDAFMTVWRMGLRYRPERGSLRSWLLSIVHHRAIDALRRVAVHDRRRAFTELETVGHEAPERTELEVMHRMEGQEVREALAALPAEQLRVIELAYFGGFTHTEIASMLGLPLGTVKGRMRLGLEKLRQLLEGVAA